jgi:YbbR domain-containing protein
LFDMTTGRVRVPLGVEAVRIIPSTISLTLDLSGKSSVVPVVPVVAGEPAPGFVVGRIAAEPAEVSVVGPVSRLRELTEVITEPIDVTLASASLESTVTLGVLDPNLRLEKPQTAAVKIEVIPAPVGGMSTQVPVQAVNMTTGLSLTMTPPSVVVTTYGPTGAMRELDEFTVQISVDLAGLGAGRYNLPVTVEQRRAREVIRIDPPVVEIALH